MTDTITIVGVIGTDPEKKTPNGVPITTFRVGSKERRFDRDKGAWVDGETNWYTVSAYRRLAEHAFDSLRRRDRVILTGRLRVRNWDTGEKRGTSVDIDVDAIGHDLLFGTTTYVSADPAAAAAPTVPSSAGDGGWAPGEADAAAWASPGVDQAGEGPDDVADPGAPQTRSGTDAPALALAGAETPF